MRQSSIRSMCQSCAALARRAGVLPVLVLAAGGTASADITSADGAFTILDAVPAAAAAGQPWVRPTIFRPMRLNATALTKVLRSAPMEFTPAARANPVILWHPMPDGTFSRFAIVESPIMEAPLAAEFPTIKTYAGQGIDDPAANIRLDMTPQGFHSQILSPNGAVYIDPYSRNDTMHYAVYYKRDYTKRADGWACHVPDGARAPHEPGGIDTPNGATLRIYRLACAATGEYTAFHGGSVAQGQAAIVTAINRVSGVYETELSVRMVLIGNNSSLVYTNSGNDPYANFNGGAMLGQNQTTCDSIIGNANYDIGHVFSTGGGGIAGLGVVTIPGRKAWGVTGLPEPIGDPFYIDYVAHEMGHQYAGEHSFNGVDGACGFTTAEHAYEPGSGSSIMAYAGICGADDLQPHSDPYFLFDSLDSIIPFIAAHQGNINTPTGNSLPLVNAGPNVTIPARTPFALAAVGTDGNPGDILTYNWEERDLGPSISLAAGDNGVSPIIRSWPASTDRVRNIPRTSNLITGTLALGELLPTTSRTLNFRCTVRDNRTTGAVGSDDMVVTVFNTGEPFAVLSPNSPVSYPANSLQTVTWNVAGTNAAPINCANVAILLSVDGGNTFPTTLVPSTPNTGSALVTMPNVSSSQSRIKVAGVNNIFFDISNVNFTIVGGPLNDNCAGLLPLFDGNSPFSTLNSTTDGPLEPACALGTDHQIHNDIWFIYIATCTGTMTADLCNSSYDSRVAVYEGVCPTGPGTAIACNDNACGTASRVTWPSVLHRAYTIRIGGAPGATGTGYISLACGPCYANCDGSSTPPILNVNDFVCFLNRFAASDSRANCDNSTVPPVLNVNDFNCFLNRFAAGC